LLFKIIKNQQFHRSPGSGFIPLFSFNCFPRQTRQRSLPHRWQEKQSGQACFFLPVLHSGTYIIPRLPDNFLKRMCKQIYSTTLATLLCYHIFCHNLLIADIPSPRAGIYAL
jgi:hypothetical protein